VHCYSVKQVCSCCVHDGRQRAPCTMLLWSYTPTTCRQLPKRRVTKKLDYSLPMLAAGSTISAIFIPKSTLNSTLFSIRYSANYIYSKFCIPQNRLTQLIICFCPSIELHLRHSNLASRCSFLSSLFCCVRSMLLRTETCWHAPAISTATYLLRCILLNFCNFSPTV